MVLRDKFRYWPTIVVSLFILIVVLLPGSRVPDVKLVGFDKIVHVIMFCTWAIALRNDFQNWRITRVILFGLFFSLLTEVFQIFVEDRSFDWYDTIADAVGLILGCVIAKPFLKWGWGFLDKERGQKS
jgi:hypothetical protein